MAVAGDAADDEAAAMGLNNGENMGIGTAENVGTPTREPELDVVSSAIGEKRGVS